MARNECGTASAACTKTAFVLKIFKICGAARCLCLIFECFKVKKMEGESTDQNGSQNNYNFELINAVKKHPAIYAKKSKLFRNAQIKDAAWVAVAKELNLKGRCGLFNIPRFLMPVWVIMAQKSLDS